MQTLFVSGDEIKKRLDLDQADENLHEAAEKIEQRTRLGASNEPVTHGPSRTCRICAFSFRNGMRKLVAVPLYGEAAGGNGFTKTLEAARRIGNTAATEERYGLLSFTIGEDITV